MDALIAKAVQAAHGGFDVSWMWRQSGARLPLAGVVTVEVDSLVQDDRAALAELRAIFYLLEDRKVHGPNRLGNGLRIEVSAGSVRKALLKGSLKSSGVGKTKKNHIAAGVDFLATKYFEAEVDVGRWRDEETKGGELANVQLGPSFPRPLLRCELLACDVSISRHAMARYIARIDQGFSRHTEDDLSAVPDARWTAAWRWFERVLCNTNMEIAKVRPEAVKRLESKYGRGTQYLRFPDTKAILVFRNDHGCMVLATVLRDDAYGGFIEKDAYMVGQRIVRGHIHERNKADRS